MRRLIAGWVLVATVAAAPAAAQVPELQAAGERVRQAWLAHDAARLVAAGGRLLIQLPAADPASPVDRAQATALLKEYLAGTTEVAVRLVAARAIEPGRGYVELVRHYRPAGTQEVRSARLLLGYRRVGARWELAELRVVE